MRLLLDTHIAVWVFMDNARLDARGRALIADPYNDVLVSAVNVLEIGIKHSLQRQGPDAMPISARQFMALCGGSGFEMLMVTADHAALAAELPPLHRDPFDRLLVAQAMTDNCRLVTHDKVVARYGEMTLAV